jgi:hypothetical protein
VQVDLAVAEGARPSEPEEDLEEALAVAVEEDREVDLEAGAEANESSSGVLVCVSVFSSLSLSGRMLRCSGRLMYDRHALINSGF